MSSHSEIISTLSTAKLRLLEQKLIKKAEGRNLIQSVIRRAQSRETARASFAQQRMWFLEELETERALYNIPLAVRFHGNLIIDALQKSLTYVTQRHEALRTTFTVVGGELVQVISAGCELDMPVVDLSRADDKEKVEGLKRAMNEEGGKRFDLRRGPLVRTKLVKLGEEEHVLLLTIHHINADGWSLDIMTREIVAAYRSFSKGEEPDLRQLEVQYADYAVWQREWLAGEVLERELEYWKKQLGGELPILNLPVDRLRPPIQTYAGGRVHFGIEEKVRDDLVTMSRNNSATVFMSLLALLDVLLSRYSGQKEILIGTPIAGRNRIEVEGLIGLFVNTLVIKGEVREEERVDEYLKRVSEIATSAYEHQEVPFEKVVEEIQPKRDLSRNPVFQVMFAMQSAMTYKVELGGLRIEEIGVGTETSKFDLTVTVRDTGRELAGTIEYNKDIYDEETIKRMARHYEILIRSMLRGAERRVSDLEMLDEKEMEDILLGRNCTEREYDEAKSIVGMIEEMAEARGEAIAVVRGEEVASYGELNRRANQLGRYLQGKGVRRESLVGLCLERSIEMVIGMLGIMKAGGAYVPLDATYPKDRMFFIVADAGTRIILTDKKSNENLPKSDVEIIRIDSDWKHIEVQSAENFPAQADSNNIAYVIYTSGSTGQPKGVMVTHRNVVNFFAGMNDCIGHEASDTILAVTSVSFDISVLELLWTLAHGTKVVILDDVAVSKISDNARKATQNRGMQFSLFYFASYEMQENGDRYRLLMDGAKFADQHGFTAVWTPERHFHSFGGLYPNPSVMSAAIAAVTERIGIRAGSVVLPLHNPIRVAEEWALVDNISRGRVSVAFASGWHADDFVFFPENYQNRREIMVEGIKTIQKLWQGESVKVQGGSGNEFEVKIFPKPIQPKLPIWITASGSPETFIKAGELGANILTHLLGQSIEELGEKIELYREARAKHGHDPKSGHVTLMLHTFISDSKERVREKVRAPFTNYLRTSIDLIMNLIKSWDLPIDINSMSEKDMEDVLAFAFDRYFETNALFGTPTSCRSLVQRLKDLNVDELACLLDFGVNVDDVLDSLKYLNELREESNKITDQNTYSMAEQANWHRATLMQCTPSLMQVLMKDTATMGSLRPLRALMLGGETLPPSLAKEVKNVLPVRLINMYGPTETTIWSTTGEIHANAEMVSIGRPIANTQGYVLDKYLRPIPDGVGGEFHISGDGVARGYLEKPALTADKFIPNPFSSEPGTRMYNTGDWVRYLSNKTIEYIGRVDYQVKIRGHRIELGEIEFLLSVHEDVAEAIVNVRADQSGNKYLVGYVVPKSDQALTARELKQFLKKKLPEYMIPQFFLILERLPLTTNGKVNRRALPTLGQMKMDEDTAYIGPRDIIEELLTEIWSALLPVERVGVTDNFFDLGGHSLLAAQMISRVREIFRVEIELKRVFEGGTIRELSESIRELLGRGGAIAVSEIKQVDRRGKIPLSYSQQRLWFFAQLEPCSTLHNVQAALRLEGELDVAVLERSLYEIVRRHEVLRTSFVLEAGVPIQVISDKWEFAIQILDLSESTPEQQERELRERMTEKVQQAFDLSLGPLLRCQLLRLSEREHVLIVHMHHIVSDGWSVGIMIRELTALYGAYGRDEESPLAGLKLQYADFAVWQREWLQGVEADTQLSYWKRQLAGAPPLLELPTDRPRPDIQTFNGARKSIFLPSNLYKSLKVMCHQENVTFFMMLLTGLNMLLHYYTDCDDIIVGTDVANRHIADTEAVIGLFVNQLVLRTDLSGDPDCRELLARVREMLIEAYSHQDLPFDRVVEVLNPERNLKHSPLFQVKLLLQNFPRATPAFAGLTLSYLTFERKTAELDLIISITETNDGLDLSMEYNTDLFNSSTIIMMANHYETLLRIIADQPEVRLSHVKSVLEKADERHSLAKREIRKRDNLKKLKSINRRAVADYIKVEDEHGCS